MSIDLTTIRKREKYQRIKLIICIQLLLYPVAKNSSGLESHSRLILDAKRYEMDDIRFSAECDELKFEKVLNHVILPNTNMKVCCNCSQNIHLFILIDDIWWSDTLSLGLTLPVLINNCQLSNTPNSLFRKKNFIMKPNRIRLTSNYCVSLTLKINSIYINSFCNRKFLSAILQMLEVK